MIWPRVPLRRVTQFAYGDSLGQEARQDGHFAVYGSNGQVGTNSKPNTLGPALIIGRKGSFGKVRYSKAPVFAIDTTFFIDRRLTSADLRWLFYALQAMHLDHLSEDVGVPGLSREKAYKQITPFPTLDVQHAITDYLDRETARLDGLIAAKRRMVELLEERRTALRDNAFGSRPGWRLKRLLANSMAYGVLVPEFVETGEGVPIIRTYNLLNDGRVSHDDIAEIPARLAEEYRRTSLRPGDVILSVVGSMGRSAVVGDLEQSFNLNRPLARLQPRREVPSRLLWHWTQTTHFMDMAKLATGGGTAQPTLNLGDLANFMVGLPGNTDRWPALLTELDEACGALNEVENSVKRQISLLQERRQALITAALTGQIDMPEAA